MKFFKKYWYLILIAVITAGLGVVTFLTSQKLSQKTPVAPNVPQVKPKAATPACTFTFSLQGTPSVTPSPTSTIVPGCGTTCTTDSQCPTNHSCVSSKCILTVCKPASAQCSEDKCSVLPSPTPTPSSTPTPSRTPTPTNTGAPTATVTPVPPSSCNNGCSVDGDCQSGLICNAGACRNPLCTTKTNCTCDAPTNTPSATPTQLASAPSATPTNPAVPRVPVAGGPSTLGLGALAAGAVLIFLGLLAF